SLARVSYWPDKIKSDRDRYGHTFNWHYTDWPDTQNDYNAQGNNGNLVTALEQNIEKLKDHATPNAEKAFAIKFIVHLMGDLHQPMHVGNGLDRGGNNCKVIFHGEKTNLHRLWDSGMIDFTKLSYSEFASFVDLKKKRKEIKSIQKGNILSWAKESKLLRLSGVYPDAPIPPTGGNASSSAATPTESVGPRYCNRDLALPDEELPKLSYNYSYKWLPELEKRVMQAGLRLAKVLNDAL
ncbi:MAG: S1/P1 nuclease, partial [Halobacteriovoraceae bacterium]|nr:S1/P1 nuclease [Halobacteriovoraceae bacterium]